MSVADYDTILWNGGGFTGMIRNIAYLEQLRRDIGPNLDTMRQFGISGGGGFALLVCLGWTPDMLLDLIMNRTSIVDRPAGSFSDSMSVILTELLDEALGTETDISICEKCNGRLYIGCVKDGVSTFISHYETREDIMRAIIYTSNIPGAISHETEFGEGICLDGGMLLLDPTTQANYGLSDKTTLVVTSPIYVPFCLMSYPREMWWMWYAYTSARLRSEGIISDGFQYSAIENSIRRTILVPGMTAIHRLSSRNSTWNDGMQKNLDLSRTTPDDTAI
jgi:hypothetical protein